MRISSGDPTKLLLAAALFLAASPVKSRANSISSNPQKRQWFGSAHDSLCSDVMCIECDVNGATARYVLRSTGVQRLGWMAIGFGRNMADSSMVIVWPSHDADGAFGSVTLLAAQVALRDHADAGPETAVRSQTLALQYIGAVIGEHPQIAFTRWAPEDGMQNIIWAFSRTPPESADADTHISIHQRIGRGTLNLTRTAPVEPVPPALPPSTPAESSVSDTMAGHEESDEKAKGERESETNGGSERPGRDGFASLMHGAFCTAGFLIIMPAGVLLHLAGGFIAGGTLAYLFTDNDASGGAVAHRAGSANLLLLYFVQCAYGSWVYRTPWQSRTRMHRVLLAGLGATIILLAVYQTWLGLVAAGHDTPVWLTLLFVSVATAFEERAKC
ncbi:hypothetical protein EDB85DRAFT_2213566 [Lactarius pseudohatsudake]|nr:hypothetical protein EDB85DRAFT_2213566 [Lactarius pseudohatsudake]